MTGSCHTLPVPVPARWLPTLGAAPGLASRAGSAEEKARRAAAAVQTSADIAVDSSAPNAQAMSSTVRGIAPPSMIDHSFTGLRPSRRADDAVRPPHVRSTLAKTSQASSDFAVRLSPM